jgi:hypothetical protein
MDGKLKEAIGAVSRFGSKNALDAVKCLREHSEDAKPLLLDALRQIVNQANDDEDEIDDSLYPPSLLYLLAEFKEHEMLDSIIQILEMDILKCDYMLGDVLTESLYRIIISVATLDDIPKLKSVAENCMLDEFQRKAALKALTGLYVNGAYPRDEFFSYLGTLLKSCYDEFQSQVAVMCYYVHAQEHFEFILEAVDDGELDLYWHIDRDDFLRKTSPDAELAILKNDYRPVTDAIKEMSGWAAFRNDPFRPKPIAGKFNDESSTSNPFSASPALEPKYHIKIIEEGTTWKKEPTGKGLKAANAAIKKNEKKQKKAKPKIYKDAPCPCGSGKMYKNCCGK